MVLRLSLYFRTDEKLDMSVLQSMVKIGPLSPSLEPSFHRHNTISSRALEFFERFVRVAD